MDINRGWKSVVIEKKVERESGNCFVEGNCVYDGGVFGRRQGQGWFEFEE